MCVNRCRKLARIKENLPMDYFFSFFSFSPMALNTSTNQLESPCCVVGLRKRYWCKMGVSTCKFDREGKKSLKCKSRHLNFFFFLSAMQECMWSKITPSVPVFYDTLSRIHPLPLLFFLTLGVLFHIYFKITIDFTWKSYLHVFPGLELCVKGTAMGEFDGFHGNIGRRNNRVFFAFCAPLSHHQSLLLLYLQPFSHQNLQKKHFSMWA